MQFIQNAEMTDCFFIYSVKKKQKEKKINVFLLKVRFFCFLTVACIQIISVKMSDFFINS